MNIHLGFVETFIPLVDPMQVAASSKSKGPSAAAIRCWAKHFSPIDRTKPTVTIPTEWMDFFSLLLLKPGSFEWAQDFLKSAAWASISSHANGNSYSFSLPKKPSSVTISEYSCYDPPSPSCLDLEEVNEEDNTQDQVQAIDDKVQLEVPEDVTPPPKPRAKHGKTPIISNHLLRRSTSSWPFQWFQDLSLSASKLLRMFC